MRQAVRGLLRIGETLPEAVGAGRHAYVLANNRAEGNALPPGKPSLLTVQGLVGCCGARPGDSEAVLGRPHIPGATRAPRTIYQIRI